MVGIGIQHTAKAGRQAATTTNAGMNFTTQGIGAADAQRNATDEINTFGARTNGRSSSGGCYRTSDTVCAGLVSAGPPPITTSVRDVAAGERLGYTNACFPS